MKKGSKHTKESIEKISHEPQLCITCNKNVAIAKRLCRNCYNKKWKKDNPEKANATQKRYRDSHLDKCRSIEEKSRLKKIEKVFNEWKTNNLER